MIGNAVVLVGFGGQGSDNFEKACTAVGNVVKEHCSYALLTFVHLEGNVLMRTMALPSGEWSNDAAKKLVALPSLAELTIDWETFLREISAALEGTLVSIVVNGEVQVALGGTIF